MDDDTVDEASEQSFSASDPPAWEPLSAGTPLRAGSDERSTVDLRPDIIETAKSLF